MSPRRVGRRKALRIAKEVAVEHHGSLEGLEIEVREKPGRFEIEFRDRQAVSDGELEHFAVWVERSDGSTRLFKGR